jgi:hypothetical protein
MMLPPEGERPDQLDTQLNKLFSTYSDIELAEIKGEAQEAQSFLATGLAESCQLLRRLQEIDVLQPLTPSEMILSVVGRTDKIHKFLRIERELLKHTKLDPGVIDYLTGHLEWLLTSRKDLPQHWREDLDMFAKLVCNEAKRTTAASRKPSLLRRAIVAGGGGLFAILNLFPPLGIPVPPPISTLSTSAGIWLISEAARDQLKAFLGK